MPEIKIHRAKDDVLTFENGVCRVPVFAGEYGDVDLFRCIVKPGADFTAELYAEKDRCQLFVFTAGTGYVATPREAFNIREVAAFIPEFDTEPFTIHASDELHFVQIIANMSDYDRENMAEARISLPRFRPVSQAWTYQENFKTNDIKSHTLVEHRFLGRLSMGAVYGTGPNVVGQHIHNELEQWYITVPGTSFTYTSGAKEIPMGAEDISYTPSGTWHGLYAKEGEQFNYVWFELCEKGYPGQLK